MGINERMQRLGAKVGCHKPVSDLFARMKRYEEIYEAMEAGLPLDSNDPDVKTCLEYEQYFAELEAQ